MQLTINIDESKQYPLDISFENGFAVFRINETLIAKSERFQSVRNAANQNIEILRDKLQIIVNDKKLKLEKFIDQDGNSAIRFPITETGKIVVNIDDFTLIEGNFNDNVLELKHKVSLPTGIIKELSINPDSYIDKFSDNTVKTDLHTHYAGAVRASELIKIGLAHNLAYPAWMLLKLGIINKNQQGEVPIRDLDSEQILELQSHMELPQE